MIFLCLWLLQGASFQMDWQINDEQKEEWAMFGPNLELAISPSNQLFILDCLNKRIVVLELDGTYVREFGQPGQGPGEFQAPAALAFNENGHLVVFDSLRRSVSEFDEKGQFLVDQLLPQGIVSVFQPSFSQQGLLLMSTVRLNAEFKQSYSLDIYDKSLAIKQTIYELQCPSTDWSRMGQPGFFVDYLKSQFESVSAGVPVGLVLGSSWLAITPAAQKGFVFSGNPEQGRELSWQHQPVRFGDDQKSLRCRELAQKIAANSPFGNQVTESVIRQAIEQSEVPAFVVPIAELFPAGDGFGFLVVEQDKSHPYSLRLFDAQGTEIQGGSYAGPTEALVAQPGRLFAAGFDEQDRMSIVGYSIHDK